jgi:hypothetical protein
VTSDEIDEFVNRYIDEMQDPTSAETAEWNALDNLSKSDPATAWQIIQRLVAASPEMYVHQVGAGPLEDLLADQPEFFGVAVQLASTDTKFREAFRYVRGVDIPAEWHDTYDKLWRSERNA